MAYDAITNDVLVNHAPEGEGRKMEPARLNTGTAQLFAYLAAAPLIAGALVSVRNPAQAEAIVSLMTLYGAAMIVFFGGVRWGVAVMKPEGPTIGGLIGAALPFAVALPLFFPGPAAVKVPAIMAVMALLLVNDLQATRAGGGAPQWYLSVRLPLTVLIEIAFLTALATL